MDIHTGNWRAKSFFSALFINSLTREMTTGLWGLASNDVFSMMQSKTE